MRNSPGWPGPVRTRCCCRLICSFASVRCRYPQKLWTTMFITPDFVSAWQKRNKKRSITWIDNCLKQAINNMTETPIIKRTIDRRTLTLISWVSCVFFPATQYSISVIQKLRSQNHGKIKMSVLSPQNSGTKGSTRQPSTSSASSQN